MECASMEEAAAKWHTTVEALEGFTDLRPVWFRDDSPKGDAPMGNVDGVRVYLSRDAATIPAKGEVWLCRLDDRAYGDFMFALPILKLDREFFEDVCSRQLVGICAKIIEACPARLKAEYFRFVEKDADNSPRMKELAERTLAENRELKAALEKERASVTRLQDQVASMSERSRAQSATWEKERTEYKKRLEEARRRAASVPAPSADHSKDVARLERTVSEKETAITRLLADLESGKAEISELRGRVKNMQFRYDTDVARLTEERDTAVRQKEAVARHSAEAPKEDAVAEERIRELEKAVAERDARIAEMAAGIKEAPAPDGSSVGRDILEANRLLLDRASEMLDRLDRASAASPRPSIRRRGGDVIESDWFTARRYTVRMTPDRGSLEIRPDPKGSAVCRNRSIRLPGLDSLVPFKEDGRYLDAGYAEDMSSVTASFPEGPA